MEKVGEGRRQNRFVPLEKISSEGWTYGVLTLTFEMNTSYLNASWWLVDSCMARIGEQGMRPGALSFEVSCMLPIALEKLKERLARTHNRIMAPR